LGIREKMKAQGIIVNYGVRLHIQVSVRGNFRWLESEVSEDNGPRNQIPSRSERPSEYLRERCPPCFGGKNCYSPDEM
jgi:hypothetical protein